MQFKLWLEAFKEVDIEGHTVPIVVNPFSIDDLLRLGTNLRGMTTSNGSLICWRASAAYHRYMAEKVGADIEIAFDMRLLPADDKYALFVSDFSTTTNHAELFNNPFVKRLIDQDSITLSPELYDLYKSH